MTGQSLRGTEEWLANYQRRGLRSGDVTSVRLVLPMPPSVNHSTVPTASGGRALTDGHRNYRTRVAELVAEAGNPRIEGRLQVDISLVPPDRRKLDLDDRIKALLDALQRANVFADDEAIDDLRIRRMPVFVPGEGAVTVVITRIVGAV